VLGARTLQQLSKTTGVIEMLTKPAFWALIALSLQPRPAAAEIVPLTALETAALRNRPALAADAARSSAAQAEIDQAQSAYYPRLLLNAQSVAAPGRSLVHVRDVYDSPTAEPYLVQGARPLARGLSSLSPVLQNQVGVQLDSNLYDFGRTRASLDVGRARYASAEAEEEATRTAIVRSVRGAYLGWLSASELYAIAAQAATDAESRRTRVEALIGEGVRPKAELSPARADEMLAKLELERARGELETAKLDLALAVGSELPASAEPDRSLLQSESDVQPAPTDPSARALELEQQAAVASARAQDKLTAPLLSANALAGLRAQGFTPFPVYAVGVAFTMPLWDGGSAKAGAAAARAHAQELGARRRQHEQQREGELALARLDARNAVARMQTAQALLEVCDQRVSEAEQSYELGAGTLEQLAQARALLRRARTELVLARVARAEAVLRVSGRSADRP
jgi:outer membrane protein TolC